MLGTENIEKLLDFGFSFSIRIAEITAKDSPGGVKPTWGELVGSIGLITKIPSAIGRADEAYEEWKDLDDTEVTAMKAKFADKFDIANDLLEATFEDVWEILLRIGKIVKRHTN